MTEIEQLAVNDFALAQAEAGVSLSWNGVEATTFNGVFYEDTVRQGDYPSRYSEEDTSMIKALKSEVADSAGNFPGVSDYLTDEAGTDYEVKGRRVGRGASPFITLEVMAV